MIFFEDQIIVEIIITMVAFALLFLMIILYVRFSYVADRRWKKSISETFQNLLAKYVNSKDANEIIKFKKRISKLSNSIEKKEILLQMIIDLYNNFSGRYASAVMELYNDLGLHNISLKKIKQRRWHVKIEGIVELATMNFKAAVPLIKPLLKHDHVMVRRQSKISLVKLDKLDGLKELATDLSPMSEWTYLSILAVLHRDSVRVNEKDLLDLRLSKNKSILSLANHLEKYSFAYS